MHEICMRRDRVSRWRPLLIQLKFSQASNGSNGANHPTNQSESPASGMAYARRVRD